MSRSRCGMGQVVCSKSIVVGSAPRAVMRVARVRFAWRRSRAPCFHVPCGGGQRAERRVVRRVCHM